MASRATRWWRRDRRDRDRGAVAVEAALTLPLVILVLFGIVELSFLVKDQLAITSSVRAGGRIASATVANGGSDCASPCTATTVPMLAELAASAVTRESAALQKDSSTQLWVYKANNLGYPGANGTNNFSTCSTNCTVWNWNATLGAFQYSGTGTWDYRTINACVNQGDSVGVYLKTTHKFITALISKQVGISDHVVFLFEPLDSSVCASRAS